MTLEKTLAYLESQLNTSSVQSDAYQSWLNDKSETLYQRYAWYAYNWGGGPKDELAPLLEALEEVNLAIKVAKLSKPSLLFASNSGSA